MTPIARLLVGTAALLLLLAPSASAADDPLVRAAAASDMTAVRALLRQGHDVDSRAADGSTALHWAVRAEDLETVNALLRAGAHATVANALGVTPVYVAAEKGNAAILRRLLDAGADVETTDASGDTLLMAAVRAAMPTPWTCCSSAARRSMRRPQFEHTALMWAVRRNDTAIMKLLLAHGADSRGAHARRREAGGPSSRRGRRLARRGHRPQRRAAAGRAAADTGRHDAAALCGARRAGSTRPRCSSKQAPTSTRADPNGITPLVMALTNGQIAVAKFLLERGADPTARRLVGADAALGRGRYPQPRRAQRRARRRERRRSRRPRSRSSRRSSTAASTSTPA